MCLTKTPRVLWEAALGGDANNPIAPCLERAQWLQPLTCANISKTRCPAMVPAPVEPLEAPGTLWAPLLLIAVTVWETCTFLHDSSLGNLLTVRNGLLICDLHRRREIPLPVRAFALYCCTEHVPAQVLGWNTIFAWISGLWYANLSHYEVTNLILVKLFSSLSTDDQKVTS